MNQIQTESNAESATRTPDSTASQAAEILIVEDSSVEAELLRRILVRAGYRVSLATNGEEALQVLRAHPCALVLSDIQMPLMDGYALCREIKRDEKLWMIPVVLVTMLTQPEDIIEALNAGGDSYITKPYVEASLLQRVRSLLAATGSRKHSEERRAEQVEYNGKLIRISAGGRQLANMLLSVYENVLNQNQDLVRIQNQLNLLNKNLDGQVQERTADLQLSEEKFHTAINSILDAFVIIESEHGTVTCWNSAAETIFGYSEKEMLGRALHEILPPPSFREGAQHGIAHFAKTGEGAAINKLLELVALRKNGAAFPIELSLTAMQIRGKWYAIGVVRDITARKQAESQLAEQINELRRWQDATLGREMRALELKREVNELLAQAGQPPRYSSAEQANAESGLRSAE